MRKIYYRWWYRSFYVLMSILLLIPAVIFYSKIRSNYFFNPPIAIKFVLYVISLSALMFGFYASKCYDNNEFLGIRQIKQFFSEGVNKINPHREMIVKGALKYVRHPYYFSGIILLWSRPLKTKDLVVNIIFTIYFIVGAINEERKLIRYYGDKYVQYRKEVPMIIPRFYRFKK